VFWISLQILNKTFLILNRIEWDTIKICVGLHVNYLLFLSYIHGTWIFSAYFSKNIQISNCIKIRPVAAALFHADWRIDRQTERHDEANSRFSQFGKAPKNRISEASNSVNNKLNVIATSNPIVKWVFFPSVPNIPVPSWFWILTIHLPTQTLQQSDFWQNFLETL